MKSYVDETLTLNEYKMKIAQAKDLVREELSEIAYFRNSPLNMLSLAENCVETLIVKAGKALKENPDLWFEWVEIWSKRRIDEGGLEQWIFLYSGL